MPQIITKRVRLSRRIFLKGLTAAQVPAMVGIPPATWAAAGILAPFALLGGLVGRPIGDRLGSNGFTLLAIALLMTGAASAVTINPMAMTTITSCNVNPASVLPAGPSIGFTPSNGIVC